MWMWCMAAASAADMAGTWAQASLRSEVRDAIDASAEASVAGLPSAYRSMAKSRLVGKADVCKRYTFRLDDAEVAWACDRKKAFVVPLSKLGEPFEVRHQGQRATVTVTMDGDELFARFDGDEGYRTIRFAFGGDDLQATASLHGPKLSAPLTWTVDYAREP